MTKKQEEWMRDIAARQRNIVFPDTASNEARFWRNIISSKRRLSTVQVIGIGIVGAAVAFVLWSMLKGMVSSPKTALLFVIGCVALFLLLRWRVGKATDQSR